MNSVYLQKLKKPPALQSHTGYCTNFGSNPKLTISFQNSLCGNEEAFNLIGQSGDGLAEANSFTGSGIEGRV